VSLGQKRETGRTDMTFDEWLKFAAWNIKDEFTLVAMKRAFDAGADSVRAQKRGKAREYYADLVARNICVRCKRKHDGKRTQCAECILTIKTAKARR